MESTDKKDANAPFPIGTPGKPWSKEERAEWLKTRKVQRSYKEEVLDKLLSLKEKFNITQYGSLPYDPERYPLFSAQTKNWSSEKPYILVTGGVHGYETSGVQGALLFLQTKAEEFSQHFNILVAPCVSPWGYETIQRWTVNAEDPNRSFNPEGERVKGRSYNPEDATDESSALIAHLKTFGVDKWTCHLDLHETTDTDESEFGPAKAARDGYSYESEAIPDGFYLVADMPNHASTKPWLTAMIEAVKKVTHIAPPDADGKILGEEMIQEGVMGIESAKNEGLCGGVTNALLATTTEVYPDSPSATPEQCNQAQVACVCGALNHIKSTSEQAKV